MLYLMYLWFSHAAVQYQMSMFLLSTDVFAIAVSEDFTWPFCYWAWQDGGLVVSWIYASSRKESNGIFWSESSSRCPDEESWQWRHCSEFRNRWNGLVCLRFCAIMHPSTMWMAMTNWVMGRIQKTYGELSHWVVVITLSNIDWL